MSTGQEISRSRSLTKTTSRLRSSSGIQMTIMARGEDGWFENGKGTDALAEYELAAGEGFILYSGNGIITLQYPELTL